MTVHIIREASVQFYAPEHGYFQCSSSALQSLVEAYFGNVNQNRRVLAAAISEATDVNYFNVDEMTLLAAAAEFGWTAELVTNVLGDLDADKLVARAWKNYAETGDDDA